VEPNHKEKTMAGKTPSFITGATAKIKVGNLTMAYAQDVSYNTTVTTIPIETMGRYEVVSNEPVAYFVDGSLSIIRYTKEASQMNGTAQNGNSVEQMVNNTGSGGVAGDGFDPARMIASETFDLEIFQKLIAAGATESVGKLRDCRFTRKGGGINKRGVLVEQFAFNAILMDNDSQVAAGNSGDLDLQP
jgi:hypothetical protein